MDDANQDDAPLTRWLCERLGEIDGWVWADNTDHTYAHDDTRIMYGRLAGTPDAGVGVRVYGGTDDEETDTKTRRVQIRYRGERGRPDGADIRADAGFKRLRRLFREGVISEVTRQSFSPSAADSNQREERTDNYLIHFDNPEA